MRTSSDIGSTTSSAKKHPEGARLVLVRSITCGSGPGSFTFDQGSVVKVVRDEGGSDVLVLGLNMREAWVTRSAFLDTTPETDAAARWWADRLQPQGAPFAPEVVAKFSGILSVLIANELSRRPEVLISSEAPQNALLLGTLYATGHTFYGWEPFFPPHHYMRLTATEVRVQAGFNGDEVPLAVPRGEG